MGQHSGCASSIIDQGLGMAKKREAIDDNAQFNRSVVGLVEDVDNLTRVTHVY